MWPLPRRLFTPESLPMDKPLRAFTLEVLLVIPRAHMLPTTAIEYIIGTIKIDTPCISFILSFKRSVWKR